jgi:hypothetical protein
MSAVLVKFVLLPAAVRSIPSRMWNYEAESGIFNA